MAQEQNTGTDYLEYAKSFAKAEKELKIKPYAAVFICKKEDNKEVILHRYDIPRKSLERWQWVVQWRKARYICADPRSHIYTTMHFYDKTSGEDYGFRSDLSKLVALKSKITLQENRIQTYIEANQGNIFFDEATDQSLQKIRAKLDFAKKRVADAEAKLKAKVEQHRKNN